MLLDSNCIQKMTSKGSDVCTNTLERTCTQPLEMKIYLLFMSSRRV